MISKIIFEICDDWINEREYKHRIFIGNFITCLSTLGIPISIISAKYPSYGISRVNLQNHLTFAFHSYNNQDNIWSYKESPINCLFSVDKKGYGGAADVSINFDNYLKKIGKIDIDKANKIINDQFEIFKRTGESKHPQPMNEPKNLPNNFIFFPLQMIDDSVTEFENIPFFSVLDKVAEIVTNKKIHVVFKRHPYCKSLAVRKKLDLLCAENDYLQIADGNIHTLIAKCDAVLACNSGASLEALIAGKPVYCYGKSEWYEACNKIETLDDLETLFAGTYIKTNTFQQKIIAFLLSEYWIKYDDLESIGNKIKECVNGYNFEYIDEQNLSIEQITKNQLDIQAKISGLNQEKLFYKKNYEELVKINRKLTYNPILILKLLFSKFFK